MEASLPVAKGPHHTVLPGPWTLSQDPQHLLQQGQLLWPICFCQGSELLMVAVDGLSRQTEEPLKLVPGPLWGREKP